MMAAYNDMFYNEVPFFLNEIKIGDYRYLNESCSYKAIILKSLIDRFNMSYTDFLKLVIQKFIKKKRPLETYELPSEKNS